MACINPRTVLSPRASVSNINVVFDGGAWDQSNPLWSGWSLTKLDWDGNPSIGVRWNGDPGPGVGNPQSRGLPVWMVLPEILAEGALERVARHLRGEDAEETRVVPPRRRLLDLIAFVRAASDEEIAELIDQLELKPRHPMPAAA
jgi:hypothetical protein